MIRHLMTIKGYYDYGMFQAVQVAAIWLRHTDAAVEEQSRIYQSRRDVLVDGLRRTRMDVEPPKAGMFLWVKPSNSYPTCRPSTLPCIYSSTAMWR